MYKVWYWTMVDRDSEGRFIASIPDLVDVAAYGATERDALANVTQLAEEHVRALVERGQSAPRASRAAEMPSAIRSKEFGREQRIVGFELVFRLHEAGGDVHALGIGKLLGVRRRRLARLGGGVGREGGGEDQDNRKGEEKGFHAHYSGAYCGGSAVACSVGNTLADRLYARSPCGHISRAHSVGASTAQW